MMFSFTMLLYDFICWITFIIAYGITNAFTFAIILSNKPNICITIVTKRTLRKLLCTNYNGLLRFYLKYIILVLNHEWLDLV